MSRRVKGGLWNTVRNSKGLLIVGIVGSLGSLAYFPIWYHVNYLPKLNQNEAFPRNTSSRGAYINSSSRDAGKDRISDTDDRSHHALHIENEDEGVGLG
ncbi:hypothetical protein FOA52_014093 [Chlamydomonas sp. UWO 241]|nr:hypothetical protein FOA52_014093 [Chlamydomonas sp. UWO 241]